ncbi:hypothetical protein ACFQ36_15685 [Arthrobacter sp. GCM10027362]|uniref:hypothetical protein n=1 Tax=Arthrobacter sp. GCM10027362 TaxID=3273379 RepID=UPI003639B789
MQPDRIGGGRALRRREQQNPRPRGAKRCGLPPVVDRPELPHGAHKGPDLIAAVLALAALPVTGQRLSTAPRWARPAIVAGGAVAGFPRLTSHARATAPASHGAVVVGLLPSATAVMAVVRGQERAAGRFRAFAALGHPLSSSSPPFGAAVRPSAQVSQVQLAQPARGLFWPALILHEQPAWPTIVGGTIVILCTGLAVRTRLNRKPPRCAARPTT